MTDIATLNILRENYQTERKKSPNSDDAIEAYHCWLEESIPFFSNYFHESDNDLVAFQNFDFETNGYGLEKIFDQQRRIYKALLNRIEKKQSYIQLEETEIIMSKKIFISHSSKDSALIDSFIDNILRLGLGLKVEDIAYTSRDDTGVRTGEDIQKFIKDNIAHSDFIFFMISPHYKESEICLNEMGAAWATERKVKPILLPNVDFDSIGWLYNVRKGIRIDDTNSLDSLYQDLYEYYGVKPNIKGWNKCKSDFIGYISESTNYTDISEPIESDEIDLLDCREIFDNNISTYSDCLMNLASVQLVYNENVTKYASQLEVLAKVNPSVKETRIVLKKLSNETDKLSASLETEMPKMRDSFSRAIDAGLKIREMAEAGEDEADDERQALKEFLESINESKLIIIQNRKDLESDKVNLDKTYTKSKKRLKDNYDAMITLIEENFMLGNKLLINT